MRHIASIEQPTHLPARYLVVDDSTERCLFATNDFGRAWQELHAIEGAEYIINARNGRAMAILRPNRRRFAKVGIKSVERGSVNRTIGRMFDRARGAA